MFVFKVNKEKGMENTYISGEIRVSVVVFLKGKFASAHKRDSKERRDIDKKGNENELKVSIFPLSN